MKNMKLLGLVVAMAFALGTKAQIYQPYGEHRFEVLGAVTECEGKSEELNDKYFAFTAQEESLTVMLMPSEDSGVMTDIIFFNKGEGSYFIVYDEYGNLTDCCLFSDTLPDSFLSITRLKDGEEGLIGFHHFNEKIENTEFTTAVLVSKESLSAIQKLILKETKNLNLKRERWFDIF